MATSDITQSGAAGGNAAVRVNRRDNIQAAGTSSVAAISEGKRSANSLIPAARTIRPKNTK